MRKIIVAAVAAASLLAAASAANAGVWINGIYYCTWGYNVFGAPGCW
jgi:hypothetical protein